MHAFSTNKKILFCKIVLSVVQMKKESEKSSNFVGIDAYYYAPGKRI